MRARACEGEHGCENAFEGVRMLARVCECLRGHVRACEGL